MRSIDVVLDISGIEGLDDPLAVATTVHLPDQPLPTATAVVALPGGGYSRRYYDLPLEGDYSQARHHTDRGLVVVALDHLCTGDSTTPADPFAVTLEQLAAADGAAWAEVRRRLAEGTLTEGLAPVGVARAVGIGQSMGGAILTVVQGNHSSFDAVAFLGWSGRHTSFPDPTGGRLTIEAPPRGADLRRAVLPEMFTPEHFRYCFHYDDVPEELVAADLSGVGPAPWKSAGAPVCAITLLSPGVVAEEAASVAVPVLVVAGERDVVPDLHAEAGAYPCSMDVTLLRLTRTGHMHNFASTRRPLWDRLVGWISSLGLGG